MNTSAGISKDKHSRRGVKSVKSFPGGPQMTVVSVEIWDVSHKFCVTEKKDIVKTIETNLRKVGKSRETTYKIRKVHS